MLVANCPCQVLLFENSFMWLENKGDFRHLRDHFGNGLDVHWCADTFASHCFLITILSSLIAAMLTTQRGVKQNRGCLSLVRPF